MLAFFAMSAKGEAVFLYGALQGERNLTELGQADAGEARYERDLKRFAYGVGGEYRFADDGDFFLGLGALFQPSIKVEQNTSFFSSDQNTNSFTSTEDLHEIALYHAYFNVYNRVNDNLSFFLGLQGAMANVESQGDLGGYDVSNGLGYRTGVEMSLLENLRSQLYFRQVVLDTEADKGYEGELDISSFMISLGYLF